MTFMEPQADHFTAYHVETTCGTEIVPADLVGDAPVAEAIEEYCEGRIRFDKDEEPIIETETGWYSRFSASGYMDRTDWMGPFDTEEEALHELAVSYDVCETCWDACWDSDSPCE